MPSILKGAAPTAAFFLILLAIAHLGMERQGAPHGLSETGPFVLSGLAASFEWSDGIWSGIIALLATASGFALFQLIFLWTGNRIVSLVAAGIVVVHPCLLPVLRGPVALLHLLPATFALSALALRALAAKRRESAAQASHLESLALGLCALAFLSGPAAFALVFILPLATTLFHPNSRLTASGLGTELMVVFSGALWFVLIKDWSLPPYATVEDSVLSRLLLLPDSVHWGVSLERVLFIILSLFAAVLLWQALRSRRAGRPQWIVTYLGLGLAWLMTTEFVCLAMGSTGGLLAISAIGLAPAALAWRIALRVFPETPEAASPAAEIIVPAPAIPDPVVPAPVAPAHAEPMDELPLSIRKLIRDSVDIAVAQAVQSVTTELVSQSAAASASSAPAEGKQYAEEWDAHARSLALKAAKRAKPVVDGVWEDQALDEGLFDNFCRPWLSPTSWVLEIGPGLGRFTQQMLPHVAHVVCLDVSKEMLHQAREALERPAKASFIQGDGHGLAGLRTGSIDFAFAYDVFVYLNQEDIWSYLRDLQRVLRPGGRAVVSFANLQDPESFRHFARGVEAAQRGEPLLRRVNYLSPEIIRTLAEQAGLAIESLHLAVNNRDMLAVLERPPAATP